MRAAGVDVRPGVPRRSTSARRRSFSGGIAGVSLSRKGHVTRPHRVAIAAARCERASRSTRTRDARTCRRFDHGRCSNISMPPSARRQRPSIMTGRQATGIPAGDRGAVGGREAERDDRIELERRIEQGAVRAEEDFMHTAVPHRAHQDLPVIRAARVGADVGGMAALVDSPGAGSPGRRRSHLGGVKGLGRGTALPASRRSRLHGRHRSGSAGHTAAPPRRPPGPAARPPRGFLGCGSRTPRPRVTPRINRREADRPARMRVHDRWLFAPGTVCIPIASGN